MKNSSPWDRFLLLAAGLIVAVLSGVFIAKSLSFAGQFTIEPAKPNNEIPSSDVGTVKIAKNFVDKVSEWKLPNTGQGGSSVPLFVSIPIVEVKGKLINMLDPNAPLVRPPVANKWLMDNSLAYLNASVLERDPDGDGFSNREEWDGKTDPKSADSHPPYVNKLSLVSRQQQVYLLRFAARPDAERFQIIRLPTGKWPKRKTFLMKVGETSDDGQFRIDSFVEKTAKNRVGINVDASVLAITYLPQKKKIDLIRNIPEQIPTYFAELDFELEPFSDKDKYVKEGDTFTIARDPKTKYRVIKVEENSATITYESAPGQEKTVEIKKK